jgi:hypothetical protein
MNAIEQLIDIDREMLIVFPNGLSTVTLVRIKADQWEAFQDLIEVIPDDQVIDITDDPLTPQAIEAGVAKLGRKARREGEYADWDERMRRLGLGG